MNQINKGTSWYLDLLRALAALGVFFSHVGIGFFSRGLWWTPHIGHEMVVIFFVLSGFVMSHTAAKLGDDWRSYVSARFSRIASVAYPALALTVVCDMLGRMADPALYDAVARTDKYWWRMLLNTLFLHQSAFLSANPGSNGPFWSLAYEVWYYVLFGIWTFVRPSLRRFALLCLAAVIAGPKIVLLGPVWMAGVVVHRLSSRVKMPPLLSVAFYAGSLVLLVALCFGWVLPLGYAGSWEVRAPLFFSTIYWADYQLGLAVAVHLVAADQIMKAGADLWIAEPAKAAVRFIADRSFSLYAYHMPLLYLASVTITYRKDKSGDVLLLVVGILVIVGLLHWCTERHRRLWARPIDFLLLAWRPDVVSRA